MDLLIRKELIGRKWLSERINNWINDKQGARILLIYGKPGSGKTAFCAHLQHYNPQVAASLACDFQSEEYSNENRIIVWIAYKMAMRIPEYRALLIKMVMDDNFSMGQGKDRFNRLLLKPLGTCNISGERIHMILLIDALDEAAGDGLMHFIRNYADLFAPWCRFLITARPEPVIKECFSGCESINIDEMSQENDKDMIAYMHFRLDDALKEIDCKKDKAEDFFKRLSRSAEGVFAYVECVCENILADIKRDPKMDIKEYPLPTGLSSLFKMSLDRKTFCADKADDSKSGFRAFWQKPLGIIISSPEPMGIDTLKKMMKWGDNDFQAFWQPLSVLLILKGDRITVFNLSFAQWLNTPGAEKYYISREDGKKDFAQAAYELYEQGQLDDFLTMYLLRFLRQTDMSPEYCKVRNDPVIINKMLDLEKKLRSRSRFQEALSVCEELETMFLGSEDEYGIYQLRNALDRIGANYWHQGDLKGSEEKHSAALALSRKLMQQHPEKREYKIVVMNSLKQVADTRFDQKDMQSAQRLYNECADVARAIVEEDPTCAANRRQLASCIARYASSLAEQDPDKAMCKYKESQEIREELIRQEPNNINFRMAETVPLVRMGEIHMTHGNTDEAEKLFYKALCLRESIMNDYPEIPACCSFYAEALDRIGDLEKKMNESKKALSSYNECLKIRKKLVSDYPMNLQYRKELIRTMEKIDALQN